MDNTNTTQIPIEAVSADQLPRETHLKYTDVCRIIGELYLQARHKEDTLQEQFQAMIAGFQERIEMYITEIGQLKSELNRLRSNGGFSEKADNNPSMFGENSVPAK